MKITLLSILLLFISMSCSEVSETENSSEVGYDENPILGKWKLQVHQKNEKSNSKMNLKQQPTEVILSIMDGGYFVMYDTFVDPRFRQKGFNRISERSKGQWELIDNKMLILHHNYEDTSYNEELIITTLNKNTLATKSKDKKAIIFKTYQGY